MKKTQRKTQLGFCKQFLVLLFLCFSTLTYAQGQGKTVSGLVKDEFNEPMVGVGVLIKGTTQGTRTDAKGAFILQNVLPENTLVFSSMTFVTQELKVGTKETFDVVMQEDAKLLDEVVVIGFQTQKKVNVTSAITTVGSDVFENRPVSNIGQALQGVIPNLNISMSSGSPNAVPSFNVRGGTDLVRENGDVKKPFVLSEGAPLIMVDGIEVSATQLNQMNPNDISTFSVLKDAAAGAIYGTRATHGVILITTKSGNFNQKARISYSYDVQWDTPAAMPDILNSHDILMSTIERRQWTDSGGAATEAEEKKLAAMLNYINNPRPENAWYEEGSIIWVASTNGYKEVVRNWTPTQKHNLSISGGSSNVSYHTSLGMQDQQGMYNVGTKDNHKRLNFATSINAKVASWFNLNGKVSLNRTVYREPSFPSGKGTLWTAMSGEIGKNVNMPIFTGPNDPAPNMPTDNLLGYFDAGGNKKTTNMTTIISLSPEFIIIPKVLKIRADISYVPTLYRYQYVQPSQKRVLASWTEFDTVQTQLNNGGKSTSSSDKYTINAYGEFEKTFWKDHSFNVLFGVNQERYKYSSMVMTLTGMLDPWVINPQLIINPNDKNITTSEVEGTNRALFGRFSYNFKERYLFQMQGRYDGSSRFTEEDRFVFYPTFSGAWRVSEEDFMKNTRTWLDNLKLKASWGKLGSQPSDAVSFANYYTYQKKMDAEKAKYTMGGVMPSGVKSPNLGLSYLTWAKSEVINVGIEVNALKNRLEFEFNAYNRKVTDILSNRESAIPAVIGVPASGFPDENLAAIEVRGWDMSVKWRDKLSNGLSYEVGFVLGDNYSKVTKFLGNPTGKVGELYDGKKIGEIWGYESGGVIQEDDLYWDENLKRNIFKGAYQGDGKLFAGQLWYKDINGDGVINGGKGVLGDVGDWKVIGNSTPRYRYGITAKVEYLGFDFSMLLQGVGKRDAWIGSEFFWGGSGGGSQWMYDRAWRPDRLDSKYPMYGASVSSQTRYLFDASFFKLKQIVLGYTLPKTLTKKAGIDHLRVNISGYNVFDVTDVPNVFDPEQISSTYPQKRSIALGIQVGF